MELGLEVVGRELPDNQGIEQMLSVSQPDLVELRSADDEMLEMVAVVVEKGLLVTAPLHDVERRRDEHREVVTEMPSLDALEVGHARFAVSIGEEVADVCVSMDQTSRTWRVE